jgi:hypothetical protein
LLRKPVLVSGSLFFFPFLPSASTTESAHRLSFPVHDYTERSYRRFVFRHRYTADARNCKVNVGFVKAIGCNFIPGRDENTNVQVSVSTAYPSKLTVLTCTNVTLDKFINDDDIDCTLASK